MPGFDKTGPLGQGSMTGRRLGRCYNFGAGPKDPPPASQSENYPEDLPERGLGLGRRRGPGPGRGRGLGLGLKNRFRGGKLLK